MTHILQTVLEAITGFVGNHGWSIVIFTMLIRFVLLPLDVKSRKSMRKMTQLNPKIERLQKKYAGDKEKLNLKMAELYRKEKINPLSGCLPMLIQFPILMWMFAAMRAIANEEAVAQVFRYLAEDPNPIAAADGWLWIKNIWVADSFFTSVAPDINMLRMIGPDVWEKVYSTFTPEQIAVIANNVNGAIDFSTKELSSQTMVNIISSLQAMPAYQELITPVPGWGNINVLLFRISLYKNYNGWLLLPVLAGVTQVLYAKMTNDQQPAPSNSSKGTGKFMQIFFPILSVYFCLTSNAGFAIYWVTSNVVMWMSNTLVNKYLEKQDKKTADAVSGEGTVK